MAQNQHGLGKIQSPSIPAKISIVMQEDIFFIFNYAKYEQNIPNKTGDKCFNNLSWPHYFVKKSFYYENMKSKTADQRETHDVGGGGAGGGGESDWLYM